MREVQFVLGGALALIIGLTVLSGGDFRLYTGPSGPGADLGYKGPGFK